MQLTGHIDSLEEVVAEAVELVQELYFAALAVPEHTLEPVKLGLHQCNVSIGLDNGRRPIFDLPQHLTIDLDALNFYNVLADFLQDAVTVGGRVSALHQDGVGSLDYLQGFLVVLLQAHPGPHCQHAQL